MNGFIDILSELDNFKKISDNFIQHKRPLNISGVSCSVAAHIIFGLCKTQNRPALVISAAEDIANEFYENLNFFFKNDVLYFPEERANYFRTIASSHEVLRQRIQVLQRLCSDETSVVVSSIGGLFSTVIGKENLMSDVIRFRVGDIINFDNVIRTFVKFGYKKENNVQTVGQFCARGGIIDFFSYDAQMPIRIELLDDEISSLRTFDIQSQRSVQNVHSCEAICVQENRAHASIFDYLKSDCLLFLYEPKKIDEAATLLERQLFENFSIDSQPSVSTINNKFFSWTDISSGFKKFSIVMMSMFPQTIENYGTYKSIHFDCNSIGNSLSGNPHLIDSLNFYKNSKYRVIIIVSSGAANLAKLLTEQGITASYSKIYRVPKQGEIMITEGSLSQGFEYPTTKTIIMCDNEKLAKQSTVSSRHKKSSDGQSVLFSDLAVGDYVVHQRHGVGIYNGLKTLDVDGTARDYLVIGYRSGDVLYVAVEQMNMLYRYSGVDKSKVKLNKLGGSEWSNTKRKAKSACEDMARELLDLYAKRESITGIAFPSDGEWQRDFEAGFPYEETPDQLKSIAQIKEDMEKNKPMDRLLCGDVGYGKTEVAMRAAFKAVTSGYQVACLAPTTVLVNQHYNTFKHRMKNYPVTIESLSRFKTTMQQKDIFKRARQGEIDIVIGTHSILNKNLNFKNLGLLIVDEEQRFGVKHKEIIKSITSTIDILTLSATPIPRTLHMSMTGIRDISILAQPPQGRYPVATYVLEHDENIIKYAICQELYRNGQVFYVVNNIDKLYTVAAKISALVPQAKVKAAHGQMSKEDLENIMLEILNGSVDVLVCTTIIENGLDMPNFNTIVVENADKLGLSQLYQLRGRVGRSNRLAYAYFTFRADKVLNEVAQKRLLAIKEFTEFGAGFKISMRDLEIRGAGNIIGTRQHGHMESVGYEMYCKLLQDSVQEMLGKPIKAQADTLVNIKIKAHIPKSFIFSNELRIQTYKQISNIENEQDLQSIRDEIQDRYGSIPDSTQNLMQIVLIKFLASQLKFTEISDKSGSLKFYFSPDHPPNFDKILVLMQSENKYNMRINRGDKPNCELNLICETESVYIDAIKKFLMELTTDNAS